MSQSSLLTKSEVSIGEFSEEEPSLVSPSPTISSFPYDDCSQSILQNVPIVSGDPMVVGYINNNDNSNVTGPMVTNSLTKGNVTGPTAALSKSNSNVKGAKAAQSKSNSKSIVTGPKVAQSNVTGPKAAQSKSKGNVTRPMETHNNVNSKGNDNDQSDLPNSQISQISSIGSQSASGALVDSDSSSPESSFKTPPPPRPRRNVSQSPSRSRSRSPLVPPASPGAHRGMPQMPTDRPSRRS